MELRFYYKIKESLKHFVDVIYSITEFKRKVFALCVKELLQRILVHGKEIRVNISYISQEGRPVEIPPVEKYSNSGESNASLIQ